MKTHDSAVLGRSPGCDITIDDDRASRHHLHFEEIEADRAYEKI
jgi:pSer/pThr/pTyr-binding forkhead associated (FHA) protein